MNIILQYKVSIGGFLSKELTTEKSSKEENIKNLFTKL